jgi:phosphotransacetylase
MRERNYFAAMMVNEGDADGLVTGHSRSYSSVVKPMLQLVDKAPELRSFTTQYDDDSSWANVFIRYSY